MTARTFTPKNLRVIGHVSERQHCCYGAAKPSTKMLAAVTETRSMDQPLPIKSKCLERVLSRNV
jgi:hypothetical protein